MIAITTIAITTTRKEFAMSIRHALLNKTLLNKAQHTNALLKTVSTLGLMLTFATTAHAEITARMGTSLPEAHPQTLGR